MSVSDNIFPETQRDCKKFDPVKRAKEIFTALDLNGEHWNCFINHDQTEINFFCILSRLLCFFRRRCHNRGRICQWVQKWRLFSKGENHFLPIQIWKTTYIWKRIYRTALYRQAMLTMFRNPKKGLRFVIWDFLPQVMDDLCLDFLWSANPW